MRETNLETAPADTPMIPSTSTMRKRRCTSTSLYSTQPTRRVVRNEFWTARIRKIPSFRYNPWDFYEPFLKLGLYLSLVLCNNETEIRVMRIFDNVREDEQECEPENISMSKKPFPLLGLQHPNFVNIYECYLFKDEIFVFTEYIGFSVSDLLFHSIYLPEREIAYIISQVSRISPFLRSNFVNIAGLGWHSIHLVQETRSPTYINREHSRVYERRGQDR